MLVSTQARIITQPACISASTFRGTGVRREKHPEFQCTNQLKRPVFSTNPIRSSTCILLEYGSHGVFTCCNHAPIMVELILFLVEPAGKLLVEFLREAQCLSEILVARYSYKKAHIDKPKFAAFILFQHRTLYQNGWLLVGKSVTGWLAWVAIRQRSKFSVTREENIFLYIWLRRSTRIIEEPFDIQCQSTSSRPLSIQERFFPHSIGFVSSHFAKEIPFDTLINGSPQHTFATISLTNIVGVQAKVRIAP
jgi:hypothetical protein